MPEPLTPRQKEVLDFVRDVKKNRGEPPTIREIAEALKLRSPGNVHRHLVELEKKGYLGLRRSSVQIQLLDHGSGKPLSEMQARVYDYVVETKGNRGTAPSVPEIVRALRNVSVGGVHKALRALEKKGYLVLAEQAYGITLKVPTETVVYPVVVQGTPCDAEDFLSPQRGKARIIPLPLADLIPYFVEADESSVFGVELLDNRQIHQFSKGDLILFERKSGPKQGGIVAVEYDHRIIVRHYWSEGSLVRLTTRTQSGMYGKNGPQKTAEDIETRDDEITIIGVGITAIIRM